MKILKIPIFLIIIFLLLTTGNFCNAQEDSGIWANMEECRSEGNCEIGDFALLAVNIAQFILGVVGSLALLFFVAGGLSFLLSAGNQKYVEWGKAAITNAVIGLIIVFTSWMIINFAMQALGYQKVEFGEWYSIQS